MIRRLRVKLVAIIMAFVTVILVCVMAAVLGLTSATLERESLDMMRHIALNPIQVPAPGEDFNGVRLPYFVLSLDEDGTIEPVGGGYYDLSDTEFLQQAAAQATDSGRTSGVLSQFHLRYLLLDIGSGRTIVFADTSNETQTMTGLFHICLLLCGAAFFAFFALSILLARWAVRPVETAWAQQKQFVADASHELKTPLTVLLTDAELLCTPEGEYTAAEKQQLSQSMLTVAQRMRVLVEQLLELARVDQNIPHSQYARLNWSENVSDALLPFEPVFYEKGLRLEAHLQENIQVRGCAAQLQQAAGIYLDNAQKYARPGTAVQVTLARCAGHRARLSVATRGEAIPQEELKNIFKRFYRTDQAHPRNGSYGLGLAIAAGVADQHGGRVWAESENGTNTFYLELKTV